MDCSTPGFPVLQHFLEFTQIHVHWVCDAIQPSHPLSSPSPLAFNLSQHQDIFKWVSSCLQSFPASGYFQMSQLFASGGQSIGAPASASVLPVNIQGWFPLGLTGWSLPVQGTLKSSPTPQFKSIHFLVLSLLYGPTLTFVHDYWENHSFNYVDFCRQSDVSAF